MRLYLMSSFDASARDEANRLRRALPTVELPCDDDGLPTKRERIAAGECNCLVATAKAEEGMDIAATNVVIRFDPILNPVSLAQSRGRARQESSDFVVLAQRPDRTVRDFEAVARRQADELASGASMMDVSAQSVSVNSGGATAIDAASAAAAFAATQGTTQTNCRVQLKELCDRFGAALAFSDATPAPGGGFACDVSVGNAHVGRGVGPRKVLAKENAAENALRALAGGSR